MQSVRKALQVDSILDRNVPRTNATSESGFDAKIKFVTEGSTEIHLAEQDFDVAAKNGQHINPVEKGHIAFRANDIEAF
jgi:hypothetical protein